ncbi:MAG TPA: thioredoxin domain-containing protein, partial [Phycisphaerae bacterium]
AAETAGILRGNRAFWQMHFWLVEHGEDLTSAQLERAIREQGYDPDEFSRVMHTEQALQPIQEDVDEAVDLGLLTAPMVFINGVELRGWNAPNAMARAVEALAVANPPVLTAEHDQPARASEKYIADWRAQPALKLASTAQPHARGEVDARLRIVVWGDYQDPDTAELDQVVMDFIAGRRDVRYEFRHFPMDKTCNSKIAATVRPRACLAARAAEAAGRIGGPEAFWRLHAWLLQNQSGFSESSLRETAAGFGLNKDLNQAMEERDVLAAIVADISAGYAVHAQNTPVIFVNEKFVPRWKHDGDPVLQRILAEAARD